MSKVVYNSRDGNAHFGRNAVMKAKFDDLLSGIRIKVIDDVVSAVLDKGLTNRFEINDAYFSVID